MTTYDPYDERVDKILGKAEEKRRAQKKRRKIALISVLSSAAALVLALHLTLFVPYTVGGYDISAYTGSEYYALMDKIGSLACTKPRLTNNFQQWVLDGLFSASQGVDMAPSDDGFWAIEDAGGATGEAAPPTSDQHYEEVTNNQVAGVVEGDLLKRSDKYLYYLSYAEAYYHPSSVIVDEYGEPIPDENGDKQLAPAYTDPAKLILNIYTVSGEKVSTYAISDEDPYAYHYGARREMYLTSDCTKILILVPYYDGDAKALFTRVLGIDVSDPAKPREFARSAVSGDYVSSRLAGNTLLLVSNFTVGRDPDFAEEKQYLPEADGEVLPMEDIVLPENPVRARFTVITSFAADALSVHASRAYFDFSENVYVSAENLYTTRTYTEAFELEHEDLLGGPAQCTRNRTEIARTSYDGTSLTYRGEMSAIGSIADQYSLDEYEGVLRVVTTGQVLSSVYSYGHDTEEDPLEWLRYPTCNLYCFDISSFAQIAAVENFAPKESVKSVRFDGDTAYVCTAEETYYEVTDPVFEFDLHDYSHITSKDTGTIPGYSMSLVKFFGGTLLGIGYGDGSDEPKIEVYASDEEKVTPLCEFKLFARFSTAFKACFIDAEHGLVGLQIDANGEHASGYLLLRFDGYALVELTTVENVGAEPDDARACLIDGTLYIFGYTYGTGECILNKVAGVF